MRLVKGSKIIYGGDDSTNGDFILAEIIDLQKQESGPTWFTVQTYSKINRNSLLDTRVRLDSNYFAEVHTLDQVDEDTFKRYLNMAMTQSDQPPVTTEVPLRPLDILDQLRDQESEMAQEQSPTPVRESINFTRYPNPNESNTIEENISLTYTTDFSSGHFKNLLGTFEIIPEKVWPQFNKIVEETGHLLFNFVNLKQREKIIELKINHERKFEEFTAEPLTVYQINRHDEILYGYYITESRWFIPELAPNTSFYLMKENYFLETIVKKATEEKSKEFAETYSEDIEKIGYEYNQASCNPTEYQIMKTSEEEKITEVHLGNNWVNAITFYYFAGGKKEFPDIDLKSFNTWPELEKLFMKRNERDERGERVKHLVS